jgi:parallel beta-helix repeat protein
MRRNQHRQERKGKIMTKSRNKTKRRGGLFRNIRPVFVLLLVPLAIGIVTATAVASGLYSHALADVGNRRLETDGWQEARQTMLDAQPQYDRKFAYHKVKEGQTLDSLAAYFGVDAKRLAEMNPGIIAAGTTIKVPAIEKPFVPASPNGNLSQAVVTTEKGLIRVIHKYKERTPIVTDIPELATFLKPYGVFEQTGPTAYRVNRPISLEGDIRLDVTSPAVTKLELVSTPENVTCLCFDQSAALFKGVEVTSYVPSTGQVDTTHQDGRSFLRMKNGRMDLLDSTFTYLGNSLDGATIGETNETNGYLKEAAMYGISWRITGNTLGESLTTGWVERSSFTHNHIGSYTYGASGMTWRDNYFAYNDVYGLDPHDDSNGALVEGNLFEKNGKHGFIISKRCNYNIIRNNLSMDNKAHGYMLHLDSAYNLVENNVSYNNEDGYVIYESDFNTVRNNVSYAARSAHVRINRPSNNNYILDNRMVGGWRGIFLYDEVKNTLISNNAIHQVETVLRTEGAMNTLLANNQIDALFYEVAVTDNPFMIFGLNKIEEDERPIPSGASVRQDFLNAHPNTRRP